MLVGYCRIGQLAPAEDPQMSLYDTCSTGRDAR
jgi:hypothetical protein